MRRTFIRFSPRALSRRRARARRSGCRPAGARGGEAGTSTPRSRPRARRRVQTRLRSAQRARRCCGSRARWVRPCSRVRRGAAPGSGRRSRAPVGRGGTRRTSRAGACRTRAGSVARRARGAAGRTRATRSPSRPGSRPGRACRRLRWSPPGTKRGRRGAGSCRRRSARLQSARGDLPLRPPGRCGAARRSCRVRAGLARELSAGAGRRGRIALTNRGPGFYGLR
jgi:hypothetical protein